MPHPFARRASAFTLIELLVVVAIIALLISILLPSLGKSRDKAKATVCLANLKGVGLAFRLYATDHEDYLPEVQNGAPPVLVSGVSYSVHWFGGQGSTAYNPDVGLLSNYWGKADIGGCPSISATDYPNNSTGYRVYYGPVDYAYNSIVGGLSAGLDGATRIRKMSQVQSPSTKALVWDSSRLVQTSYIFSRTPWGYPTDRTTTISQLDPNFHGRHAGNGNVSWLDGHAESFKPYVLSDLSPLGSTTFTGTAPSAQGPQDKLYNIGFIYDGPNPPPTSLPTDADKYYDPNF